ncbi:hypothetical protein FKM82_022368 [Ascaphus truei]
MGCSSSKLCLYSPCAATRREESLKKRKELSQELVNLRGDLGKNVPPSLVLFINIYIHRF